MNKAAILVGFALSILAGCRTGNHIAVPPDMVLHETYRFTVAADQDWQKGGFEIQEGEFVRLSASGYWTGGVYSTGPEGDILGSVGLWIIPPLQIAAVLRPLPFGRNFCLVGELANGQRIAVGRAYSIDNRAGDCSGSMQFRNNDPFLRPNSGELNVVAEIFRRTMSTNSKPPDMAVHPAVIRNVHVLVVGIGDYRDAAIRPLKYSAADAQAVYDFFATSDRSPARKENVHFLGETPNVDGLTATKAGIQKAITQYLIRGATHEDDMAILYFSGHGDAGTHPVNSAGYYLLPMDAEAADLFSTALEVEELQRYWQAIRAKSKVLITDACNAGGFAKLKDLNIRGLETIEGGGTIVITGATGAESSVELDEEKRGLFTHLLLEGLNGKADALAGDNDGRVTLAELRSWLEKQVPSAAAKAGGKQTPVVKVPEGWEGVYLTK